MDVSGLSSFSLFSAVVGAMVLLQLIVADATVVTTAMAVVNLFFQKRELSFG